MSVAYTLDFISYLFDEWTEIHGDRKFGDDAAVVTGFARFKGEPCCVVGHQKGHTTKESVARNFGLAKPEGFRKAQRLFRQAERLGLPVITLLDTSG